VKTKILSYSLLAAVSILAPANKALAADSTVVADFETQTNRNNINGFWYFVDDQGSKGTSKITSGDTTVSPVIFSAASFGEGAQNPAGFSAKLEYTLGTTRPRNNPTSLTDTSTYSPFVLIGTNVVPVIGTELDLTGATALSFWAKATPPVKVSIAYLTADVKDYSYARSEIAITTTWKRYTANFAGTTGNVFKGTWGTMKDKYPTLAKSKAFDFAIMKDTNPVTKGVLQLDDVVLNGWKDPNAAGIRNVSGSNLTKALRASVDGKSLRFNVPEAYRNVAGTVAAIDLSGKTVAKAAFAKGQQNVSLTLAGPQAATVFLRVFTGTEAL